MVDNYRPRFFTVRGSQQVDTKKKDFEKEIRRKEGIFKNTALKRITFVGRAIRSNRTELRRVKYFPNYYLVTSLYCSLRFIANNQR
jgi:hypothetical protein